MRKALVLDTNLALLFVVGATDRSYIEKHKRLQRYTVGDFELLSLMIDESAGVVLCPNVVSETSNLIRYIAEPYRTEISLGLVELIKKTTEHYVPSKDAVEVEHYIRIGVTDSALLLAAETDAVLLTDDFELHRAALERGTASINYNHVREEQD